MAAEIAGTRDEDTMRAYAQRAHAQELRAVLIDAEQSLDLTLVAIIRTELNKRGL